MCPSLGLTRLLESWSCFLCVARPSYHITEHMLMQQPPKRPSAPPPAPGPAFFHRASPTMDWNKRPLQLNCTVRLQKHVFVNAASEYKIKSSNIQELQSRSPHPASPPAPLINFQGISHRRLANRGPLRWEMAVKVGLAWRKYSYNFDFIRQHGGDGKLSSAPISGG